MATSSIQHSSPQNKLPPGSNFADAFWDGQNKGVDIIMSRLRKSKDTCEEIKKLYELRASIEQDYGDRLLKLAQNLRIGEFEEDSFAETLTRIPSALETTARAHIDLAQQLKDHLESPLDGFLKDQRDIRKMRQQQIENSKQLKNLHEADVARARDYYSIECNKLISLEKYYFSLKENHTSNDEIVKIEKETEEQRRMVTVADQVYRRSVDNFNSVNEKWVSDWTTSADKFQEMEYKRIGYLRSTLWSFANMMTSTFSIDEECCDRIRTALEITDVQKDITDFVQRYGTGTRIPAPLSYEVLYHQTSPPPLTTQQSQQSSHSIIPPAVEVVAAATATTAAAAYAATIINKEATEHQQQPQPLSAPIPQSSLDSLPAELQRGASESATSALKSAAPTIITNPDEELKSVDRQLQKLEVQNTTPLSEDEKHFFMQTSPQQITAEDNEKKESNKVADEQHQQAPLSGVTNTTDQSNGPFNIAFKEVEQILNRPSSYDEAQIPTPITAPVLVVKKEDTIDGLKTHIVASNRASYASNTQTIPPIMMARSIHSEALASPTSPRIVTGGGSDEFSADIYNALGINNKDHSSQYDLSKQPEETAIPPPITKINTSNFPLAAVQLAPLSSETPILSSFESFQHNSNEAVSTDGHSHKYKPMPNPIYSNHSIADENKDPNQRPVVGVRTSSLLLARGKQDDSNSKPSSLNNVENVKNNDDDDDEEDDEDKAYHNRMPRPPPKDEKWVISSIRRPQQLPVRTMNARLFDGNASISRNSVISGASPANTPPVENSPASISAAITQPTEATPTSAAEENGEHQPKVHRPVIALTIDIPNSIKPTPDLPQNAAQQVIAEGRRLSQMSPIQQKMNLNYNQQQQQPMDPNMMRNVSYGGQQNGLEDNGGGIRPAPWNEDLSSEDHMPKNNSFTGVASPTMNNANIPPQKGYYPSNGHMSYQAQAPVPRDSSLKLSNQDLHQQQQMQMQQQQEQQQTLFQQQQYEEENKKRFAKKNGKEYSESSIKSNKDKDNSKTGRFSLGFFMGGNKKEKKKEKEAAAAAAAAVAASVNNSYPPSATDQQYPPSATDQQYPQYQQQQPPTQQQQYNMGLASQQHQMQQQQQMQRPQSQQIMYQNDLSQSDIKSTHSSLNNNNHIQSAPPMQQQPPSPQPQQPQPPIPQQQQSFDGSRYIGYAKAQWPFEATIDGEMSFHAEEVVGIIRKQTDGWWEAERLEPAVAGQRGLVPGNYMIEAASHPPATA